MASEPKSDGKNKTSDCPGTFYVWSKFNYILGEIVWIWKTECTECTKCTKCTKFNQCIECTECTEATDRVYRSYRVYRAYHEQSVRSVPKLAKLPRVQSDVNELGTLGKLTLCTLGTLSTLGTLGTLGTIGTLYTRHARYTRQAYTQSTRHTRSMQNFEFFRKICLKHFFLLISQCFFGLFERPKRNFIISSWNDKRHLKTKIWWHKQCRTSDYARRIFGFVTIQLFFRVRSKDLGSVWEVQRTMPQKKTRTDTTLCCCVKTNLQQINQHRIRRRKYFSSSKFLRLIFCKKCRFYLKAEQTRGLGKRPRVWPQRRRSEVEITKSALKVRPSNRPLKVRPCRTSRWPP
jgi:hypothetical protein